METYYWRSDEKVRKRGAVEEFACKSGKGKLSQEQCAELQSFMRSFKWGDPASLMDKKRQGGALLDATMDSITKVYSFCCCRLGACIVFLF